MSHFRGYILLVQLMAVYIGCLWPQQLLAATSERLGIIGVAAASTLNPSPFDSTYSWIGRVYTDAAFIITWRLHPGNDGGVVFSLSQPPEALTAEFVMLNFNTTLYSVGMGITKDANNTIRMTNLRKQANSTIFDMGSGPGVNPLIPLVADITSLSAGENGWMLNGDGTYHLIYNTHAECAGCTYIVHLYGDQLERGSHGDVNLDGYVDTGDILLMERYYLGMTGLTVNQKIQADLAPPGAADGLLGLPDLFQIIQRAGNTQ